MTDHLKTIWKNFEGATSRRLTGSGVDNIHVPSRQDLAAEAEQFLPENFETPATAAFAALKERLAESERHRAKRLKGEAKEAGRRTRGEYRQDFPDEPPPAPLSAEAYSLASEDGAPNPAMEMMKGLHATQMRVDRADSDYVRFLAMEEERTGHRKGRVLRFLKKIL